MEKVPVYWQSPVPRKCDLCGKPIDREFVDGRLGNSTKWFYSDLDCYAREGSGFGLGLGQRYVRQEDGRFLKVEG